MDTHALLWWLAGDERLSHGQDVEALPGPHRDP
jgi:hypothetical protein